MRKPWRMPLPHTHSGLVRKCALIGIAVLALASCTIGLPDDARIASLQAVANKLDEADQCIPKEVQANPESRAVSDFAAALGSCVNVFLLAKTADEIRDQFRPSGSGNYLVSAVGDDSNATLTILSAGVGRAISGAWNQDHTTLVCWSLEIDLTARTVETPVDVSCENELIEPWSNPKDTLALDDVDKYRVH